MPSETVKAKITYQDVHNSLNIRLSTGHLFQMGGEGDGYCYDHGSFDCIDHLTHEERRALENAK